jgi:hypothetical protein
VVGDLISKEVAKNYKLWQRVINISMKGRKVFLKLGKLLTKK